MTQAHRVRRGLQRIGLCLLLPLVAGAAVVLAIAAYNTASAPDAVYVEDWELYRKPLTVEVGKALVEFHPDVPHYAVADYISMMFGNAKDEVGAFLTASLRHNIPGADSIVLPRDGRRAFVPAPPDGSTSAQRALSSATITIVAWTGRPATYSLAAPPPPPLLAPREQRVAQYQERSRKLDNGSLAIAAAMAIGGSIAYALCYALGWIIAGFMRDE